ncbi:ABC transporter substrate-binding protein [uncultured Pontibacter sp.]|uniref:ABC transporter substrate-binding protein n=1 Tax=uncultured Pontibacter sp. TaxID=453356 RepID=UPI002612FE5C|nr:ABC transporter substrate-binding protein [uncultured Pontibacter sp.]
MRKILAFSLSFLILLLSFCSQPERQPDEVRVRLVIDPANLNPVSYNSLEALQIINLLYNSLLTVDLDDNTLKPGLASSFPEVERNDSLSFFRYSIRPEAEWADGSPVTGHDVAFTLKLLKAPHVRNEQIKPQVEFIRDVIVSKDNPKHFTLVCTGFSPEMELLTGDFFILPEYLLDPERVLVSVTIPSLIKTDSTQYNTTRIKTLAERFNRLGSTESKDLLLGSGGYTLSDWASGQYITLQRKENWWGGTTGSATSYLTAKPERISFQIIPDNTTALLALQNRQLDVLDNIPVAEFEQLRQNASFQEEYNLHAPQGFDLVYAGINSRSPKLSDKRTRQAIAHLMDAASLIKVTQQSYASPTVGPVPPSVKSFYHSGINPYTFNPEEAIRLLKSAGWIQDKDGWYRNEGGQRLKLDINLLYRAGNTVYEQTALIFQQNAAKVGIPVTLQALEGNVYSQKLDQHDFDMFLRGISGNPFVFNYKPLFHTSYAGLGGFNTTGFGTPESDALLDEINTSQDPEEKARLLKRLQEILHEEATFLSLYFRKEKMAIHNRFTNTKVSGVRPYYDLSAFMLKP